MRTTWQIVEKKKQNIVIQEYITKNIYMILITWYKLRKNNQNQKQNLNTFFPHPINNANARKKISFL